jgi:predicted nucleotidyltransferase
MQPMYTIQQMQDRLSPVFRKNGVRKATLFGSYSKGTAHSGSDVDLMVDSGLRGLKFYGLLEDVCQCLQCEVDLIDASQIVPNSLIDQEIRRTGVVIYEQ